LAEGIYRAGLTALMKGDVQDARRFADELGVLAERLDDDRLRGMRCFLRSGTLLEEGDAARAIEVIEEGIARTRKAGDAYNYAFCQNLRGEIARSVGDAARAKLAYHEQLRIAEQLQCKRYLA